MKTIVFMVIGWLFLVLIGMEGVPLITPQTVKLLPQNRTLIPIISTKPTPPRTLTNCPPLFTLNNIIGKCYFFINATSNFNTGNNACVGYGGSLAMPKSDDELVFLAQMLPSSQMAWVSVTYRTINGTSAYYFSDGTPYTLCTSSMSSPNPSFPVMGVPLSFKLSCYIRSIEKHM